MDQLIRDAKTLVQRLQSHDSSADSLISEATHLQNKLHAMKQYRDEVSKLNEIAKHRPKSTLILGSQLENQRIQELELEVGELTVSLAEHQSALELIMNKYREQVLSLLESNGVDKGVLDQVNREAEDVKAMKEKILEMAAIMQKAMRADDVSAHRELEVIQSLQAENETLRELLHISGRQAVDTSTVIRRKPKHMKAKQNDKRVMVVGSDKLLRSNEPMKQRQVSSPVKKSPYEVIRYNNGKQNELSPGDSPRHNNKSNEQAQNRRAESPKQHQRLVDNEIQAANQEDTDNKVRDDADEITKNKTNLSGLDFWHADIGSTERSDKLEVDDSMALDNLELTPQVSDEDMDIGDDDILTKNGYLENNKPAVEPCLDDTPVAWFSSADSVGEPSPPAKTTEKFVEPSPYSETAQNVAASSPHSETTENVAEERNGEGVKMSGDDVKSAEAALADLDSMLLGDDDDDSDNEEGRDIV